jgi:putative sterol carrier protein
MTVLDTRFEKLRSLCDQVPLDDLAQAVACDEGGVDEALEVVFDVYKSSFDPQNAEGVRADFLFEIETPEGTKPYSLSIQEATCAVAPVKIDDPTATIRVGLADFLHMSLGKTNGAVLAMAGRLEVGGDVIAAISFGEWFNPPWDQE